jgi:uncharacterized membrane protein
VADFARGIRFASDRRSTTMLGLNQRQREAWITTFSQAANVMLAGLLVGQLVNGRPFSLGVALLGVGGWAALLGFVTLLAEDEPR